MALHGAVLHGTALRWRCVGAVWCYAALLDAVLHAPWALHALRCRCRCHALRLGALGLLLRLPLPLPLPLPLLLLLPCASCR